jgi:UDP-N-acetylglucosamine--N-acetylmuramyl-(pentapeptide) pyrophosphoryl-undecaprenol N-acetylglucosamine transferase
MKILFTGGGTGGHFYPIIAVAQELRHVIFERKLLGGKFYFMSDHPYNEKLLRENEIIFVKTPSGKWRRYFSLRNFIDSIVLVFGILIAIWKLFIIYPDVIFSKGGYASMPTAVAARILGIPFFIHESDSHPGRANLWAGRFATRIALSYPEAIKYFKADKTAVVGNPIRREIMRPIPEGARKFLKLEEDLPVIFILGGSLGAQAINNVVLDALPDLVKKYQIVHQTGHRNYKDVVTLSSVILEKNEHANRYQPFPFLDNLAMRMAAGIASLVVSRAGSTIFEIAEWGIPSIIIPIPEIISHDQRSNAFAYARAGGAVVIEEENLSPSILISEIDRILSSAEIQAEMKAQAKSFSRPDAGRKVAEEIIDIAFSHES